MAKRLRAGIQRSISGALVPPGRGKKQRPAAAPRHSTHCAPIWDARGCKRMQKDAKGCKRMQRDAKGCEMHSQPWEVVRASALCPAFASKDTWRMASSQSHWSLADLSSGLVMDENLKRCSEGVSRREFTGHGMPCEPRALTSESYRLSTDRLQSTFQLRLLFLPRHRGYHLCERPRLHQACHGLPLAS